MEPRIFSHDPLTPNSDVTLTGTAASHIARVLRLREGNAIVVFDGRGLEYEALIGSVSPREVRVAVGQGRDPGTESRLVITLLQGICRSQRMDLVIRKSTELGVGAIHPLSCERSVVRLDDARGVKKSEHWRQIAISACEQSGRVCVPEILAPATLTESIETLSKTSGARLLLDPRATMNLGKALDTAQNISLLIGPEGGLTTAEGAAACAGGFVPVRLGPRILRTETAPLAALSILQYLAGDLG